jgi:sugar/nucleoside kinase (ribokinase family)
MPTFDVLGLGCTAVDDLLTVAVYPSADTKVPILRAERRCGGNTATALLAAARLGARCAFAGTLGDDEHSRFVLDAFRCAGVDTAHHVHRPGARPIRVVIVAEYERPTRTIFYDLSDAYGADPERPAAEVITTARVLLVDHFGVEGMTRAVWLARAAGIPIVGDLENDGGPGFAGLLALVDHLIMPHAFAVRLTGEPDPVAAVHALWNENRRLVAVTRGADGCWYRAANDTTIQHQPAFPVEARDTTGCGDVFHGAYAAALAWGWEAAERIRFASASAALKATGMGCPTRAAVESLQGRGLWSGPHPVSHRS